VKRTSQPAGESGPENLSDVLGRLFAARGWGRQSGRAKLEAAWAAAVGPEFLPDTRVLVVRRGVLEVEVRNGVLMQELAQFHKRKLLAAVRTGLPGTTLTDLKFRAGIW
jgi:predicted nucleic acid-binding Zn ribbon protein